MLFNAYTYIAYSSQDSISHCLLNTYFIYSEGRSEIALQQYGHFFHVPEAVAKPYTTVVSEIKLYGISNASIRKRVVIIKE